MILIFFGLGATFVLTRVPGYIRAENHFESWDESPRSSPTRRPTSVELPGEPATDDPLATRQRFNIGLIVVFGQALQITLVVVALTAFFVVFGVLAIGADTVAGWTGHRRRPVLADLDIGDRTLVLTEPLIRVSVFLGAFSGMYFTVVLWTDDTYRTEFANDVGPEIRQILAVARGLPRACAPNTRRRPRRERPTSDRRGSHELPTTADEMVEVVERVDAVWGSTPPVVTVELLTAVAHAGGYVGLARDRRAAGRRRRRVARHARPPRRRPALHSHVTALVAGGPGNRRRAGAQAPSTRLGRRARARLDRVDVRSARAPQRLVQPRGARRRRARVPAVVLRRRCRTPSTPATSPTDCSSSGTSHGARTARRRRTARRPRAGACSCRHRRTSSNCAAPIPPPSPAGEPSAATRSRRARRRPADRRIHRATANYVIGSTP